MTSPGWFQLAPKMSGAGVGRDWQLVSPWSVLGHRAAPLGPGELGRMEFSILVRGNDLNVRWCW